MALDPLGCHKVFPKSEGGPVGQGESYHDRGFGEGQPLFYYMFS